MVKISKEGREARNAYHREYQKKNRKRTRQYQIDYWERKAKELAENVEADPPTIDTATDKERALLLRTKGLSIRQIAENLELSKSKVERLLSQAGQNETLTGRDSGTE